MNLRQLAAGALLVLLGVGCARADMPFGVDFRYVNIMPGQTLGEIIASLYADSRVPRPLLVREMVRLNPHAFPGADPNRMLAGIKLVLPRDEDLLAASQTTAGRVTRIEGQPRATGAFGATRDLEPGGRVFVGDLLSTAAGARLHLMMSDGAHLYLRPCSEFRIDEYIYQAGRNGRSRMQLLRGGVATRTGAIGREFRRDYALATPVATVGVRGTEFALRYCADRQCRQCVGAGADDDLHVGVTRGAVEVDLGANRVEVESDTYLLASGRDGSTRWSAAEPADLLGEVRDGEPPLATQAAPATAPDTGRGLWWVLGGLLLLILL